MSPLLVSSRDQSIHVTAAQAIIEGLASDGGLFVPESLSCSIDPVAFRGESYQKIASTIIHTVFKEFPEKRIEQCVRMAYDSGFSDDAIAPLRPYQDGYLLELWHGPTGAFKDIALTILPHLLTLSRELLNRQGTVAILTATSGDTGKAALSGFADIAGTDITVFYPRDGVSLVQKLQMQTALGSNVEVVAVEGNFDDCQKMVKEAYGSNLVRHNCKNIVLSSANSINIGRLVPQIVYYFSAYARLLAENTILPDQKVNFTVPTGNFGNILAGYMARRMGLPIGKLICATNRNCVLADFMATGIYDANRPFYTTISPSMDILVSSNLERLLFLLCNDGQMVSKLMKDLSAAGHYQVPDEIQRGIQECFIGYSATEDECRAEIRRMWHEERRVIDPHTAVALCAARKYRTETKDQSPQVVLSTASPYKFPGTVLSCIDNDAICKDEFECMDRLQELSGEPLPKALAEIGKLPVRFCQSITRNEGIEFIAEKMKRLSNG